MMVDEEALDYFTQLVGAAGAMLYGRNTYELMEGYWPAVAHDEIASRSDRDWARTLEEMPKHVVSTTRREFSWKNTFHVDGDLRDAVTKLKAATPEGVLVGSPLLSAELERLGLIDDYHFIIHPVIAGHGPFLFQGLPRSQPLELLSSKRLSSGITVMHYRRKVE